MEAQPNTAPKPFVLVLMPFKDELKDIYNLGIKETCIGLNTYCERIDEQQFHERILDRIYNQIAKADILIADMTGLNANVFYEVGYAHGLGKNVIMLIQNPDEIPFDFKHFPFIVYGKSITKLRELLSQRMNFVINNPDKAAISTVAPLEYSLNGVKLSEHSIPILTIDDPGSFTTFDIQVYNPNTFSKELNLIIGIIASHPFAKRGGGTEFIKLDNNQYLHQQKFDGKIFPKGWNTNYIELGLENLILDDLDKPIDMILREFSEAGIRDFGFQIIIKRRIRPSKNFGFET